MEYFFKEIDTKRFLNTYMLGVIFKGDNLNDVIDLLVYITAVKYKSDGFSYSYIEYEKDKDENFKEYKHATYEKYDPFIKDECLYIKEEKGSYTKINKNTVLYADKTHSDIDGRFLECNLGIYNGSEFYDKNQMIEYISDRLLNTTPNKIFLFKRNRSEDQNYSSYHTYNEIVIIAENEKNAVKILIELLKQDINYERDNNYEFKDYDTITYDYIVKTFSIKEIDQVKEGVVFANFYDY